MTTIYKMIIYQNLIKWAHRCRCPTDVLVGLVVQPALWATQPTRSLLPLIKYDFTAEKQIQFQWSEYVQSTTQNCALVGNSLFDHLAVITSSRDIGFHLKGYSLSAISLYLRFLSWYPHSVSVWLQSVIATVHSLLIKTLCYRTS